MEDTRKQKQPIQQTLRLPGLGGSERAQSLSGGNSQDLQHVRIFDDTPVNGRNSPQGPQASVSVRDLLKSGLEADRYESEEALPKTKRRKPKRGKGKAAEKKQKKLVKTEPGAKSQHDIQNPNGIPGLRLSNEKLNLEKVIEGKSRESSKSKSPVIERVPEVNIIAITPSPEQRKYLTLSPKKRSIKRQQALPAIKGAERQRSSREGSQEGGTTKRNLPDMKTVKVSSINEVLAEGLGRRSEPRERVREHPMRHLSLVEPMMPGAANLQKRTWKSPIRDPAELLKNLGTERGLRLNGLQHSEVKLQLQIDKRIERCLAKVNARSPGQEVIKSYRPNSLSIGFAPSNADGLNFNYLAQISPKHMDLKKELVAHLRESKLSQDANRRQATLVNCASKKSLDSYQGFPAESAERPVYKVTLAEQMSAQAIRAHIAQQMAERRLEPGIQVSGVHMQNVRQENMEKVAEFGYPVQLRDHGIQYRRGSGFLPDDAYRGARLYLNVPRDEAAGLAFQGTSGEDAVAGRQSEALGSVPAWNQQYAGYSAVDPLIQAPSQLSGTEAPTANGGLTKATQAEMAEESRANTTTLRLATITNGESSAASPGPLHEATRPRSSQLRSRQHSTHSSKGRARLEEILTSHDGREPGEQVPARARKQEMRSPGNAKLNTDLPFVLRGGAKPQQRAERSRSSSKGSPSRAGESQTLGLTDAGGAKAIAPRYARDSYVDIAEQNDLLGTVYLGRGSRLGEAGLLGPSPPRAADYAGIIGGEETIRHPLLPRFRVKQGLKNARSKYSGDELSPHTTLQNNGSSPDTRADRLILTNALILNRPNQQLPEASPPKASALMQKSPDLEQTVQTVSVRQEGAAQAHQTQQSSEVFRLNVPRQKILKKPFASRGPVAGQYFEHGQTYTSDGFESDEQPQQPERGLPAQPSPALTAGFDQSLKHGAKRAAGAGNIAEKAGNDGQGGRKTQVSKGERQSAASLLRRSSIGEPQRKVHEQILTLTPTLSQMRFDAMEAQKLRLRERTVSVKGYIPRLKHRIHIKSINQRGAGLVESSKLPARNLSQIINIQEQTTGEDPQTVEGTMPTFEHDTSNGAQGALHGESRQAIDRLGRRSVYSSKSPAREQDQGSPAAPKERGANNAEAGSRLFQSTLRTPKEGQITHGRSDHQLSLMRRASQKSGEGKSETGSVQYIADSQAIHLSPRISQGDGTGQGTGTPGGASYQMPHRLTQASVPQLSAQQPDRLRNMDIDEIIFEAAQSSPSIALAQDLQHLAKKDYKAIIRQKSTQASFSLLLSEMSRKNEEMKRVQKIGVIVKTKQQKQYAEIAQPQNQYIQKHLYGSRLDFQKVTFPQEYEEGGSQQIPSSLYKQQSGRPNIIIEPLVSGNVMHISEPTDIGSLSISQIGPESNMVSLRQLPNIFIHDSGLKLKEKVENPQNSFASTINEPVTSQHNTGPDDDYLKRLNNMVYKKLIKNSKEGKGSEISQNLKELFRFKFGRTSSPDYLHVLPIDEQLFQLTSPVVAPADRGKIICGTEKKTKFGGAMLTTTHKIKKTRTERAKALPSPSQSPALLAEPSGTQAEVFQVVSTRAAAAQAALQNPPEVKVPPTKGNQGRGTQITNGLRTRFSQYSNLSDIEERLSTALHDQQLGLAQSQHEDDLIEDGEILAQATPTPNDAFNIPGRVLASSQPTPLGQYHEPNHVIRLLNPEEDADHDLEQEVRALLDQKNGGGPTAQLQSRYRQGTSTLLLSKIVSVSRNSQKPAKPGNSQKTTKKSNQDINLIGSVSSVRL